MRNFNDGSLAGGVGQKTCSEGRRESRRVRDPHHQHPLKRYYLGPTPVSSQAADSVAQAIAEDSKIVKPSAIVVPASDGKVIVSRASEDTSKGRSSYTVERIERQSSFSGAMSTQTTPSRKLAPLQIPRGDGMSWHANRPLMRRQSSGQESFISARSMPDSVLSEADLPVHEADSKSGRRALRRDTSAAAELGTLQASPTKKVPREYRRRISQSSFEPPRDLGRKKLSFEVVSPKDRRGRSEGGGVPLASSSILQKEPASFDTDLTPRKQHLEPSVLTEEPTTIESTPTSNHFLHSHRSLRGSSSFRSMGRASKSSLRMQAVEETAPHNDRDEGTSQLRDDSFLPPLQHGHPPLSAISTEGDTSIGFDTSRAAKLKALRDRARRTYQQSKIGQGTMPPRTSTLQSHQSRHYRDVSRQSRMSRASTAGTLGSIGTRFSEGSFGVTGGVRSRLVQKFGIKPSKAVEVRARGLKLETQKHRGRHHRGGVLPGAVGTSAGGTKWVGQSFEVGKRFWELLESREEALKGDTIEEESPQEEQENVFSKGKVRKTTSSGDSHLGSPLKNRSDVLDTFARNAKHASNVHDRQHLGDRRLAATAQRDMSFVSAKTTVVPCPPTGNIDKKDLKKAATKESSEEKQIHGKTEGQEIPSWRKADIENRSGWDNVKSFMSSGRSTKGQQMGSTSERDAADTLKEAQANTANVQALRLERAEDAEEMISAEPLSIDDNSTDVVSSKKPMMSAREALTHPEPPLGAEERFPQATFELMRRPSDLGVRPGEITEDAASDHEVAARPTSHPDTPSSSSKDGKVAGSPLPSPALAFLKRSVTHEPATEKGVDARATIGKLSALYKVGKEGERTPAKKSVQFRGPSAAEISSTKLLSPSYFNTLNRDTADSSILLGGRARRASRGDDAPAPPEEVLSRSATPDGILTPQGKTADPRNVPELITRKSVLKRDRMLVKLGWTPSEYVPQDFNEIQSRKYTVYYEDFQEYMVVYRTGRLELWEDHSAVYRYLGIGHTLKLHTAAALRRGRAFISTYSAIDGIFCVTFTKDDDNHHRLLPLRRSGTCIWIFDARSSTIAADWMWELWRELDGDIPASIDVHLAALNVRVRIAIPEELIGTKGASNTDVSSYYDAGEGYKLISRDYVKGAVRKVIEAHPEWRQLCINVEGMGVHFELAWRNGVNLDWITEDFTSSGERRDWVVLVGGVQRDHNSKSVLEYRPAVHYPTRVRMPGGETMEEPAGVEGFIWRVKAVSGVLSRIYVTTHDSLIFVNRPSKAFPPDRHLATASADAGHVINNQSKFVAGAGIDQIEQDQQRRKRDAMRGRKKPVQREESLADLRRQVMSHISAIATTEEELDAQIEAYRAFEKRRRFEQINNADGFFDLRDIVVIKSLDDEMVVHTSAEQIVPTGEQERKSLGEHGKDQPQANGIVDQVGPSVDGEEEKGSEEDLGGEEGLALAKDRMAMRRRRQIEIILHNGRSVRLEAYSVSVAKEWVSRLGALSRYWKRRQKVDAMELMAIGGFEPALFGKRQDGNTGTRNLAPSVHAERMSSELGRIWHWCMYHDCRGIIHSGRLFQKKKAFSGFYSRFYVLIAGRLLHYKLMTSTSTARARQNSGIFHRRQETVVHLRDAYVYSGHLTEDMLVNGRSEGAGAINTFGKGTGGASSATNRHILPRVYGDGLLSTDDDEDCTFVIRYRPQRVNQAADPKVVVIAPATEEVRGDAPITEKTTTPASPCSIPALGDSTFNFLILRARSKMERDLWVRAIKIERERLNREDREREERIRNQGETPWKTISR